MSSIVGHALAGISAASAIERGETKEKRRTLLALVALLSIVPDLDVLVPIVLRPLGTIPHRGTTHTLAFALLLSAVVARALDHRFGLPRPQLFLAFAGAVLSHPILDCLMGCGPAVPFFWPVSERGFLLPFRLVPTAYYSLSAAGLLSVAASPETLLGILLEATIFLPLFLISRRRPGTSRLRPAIIAALGIVLTLWIYNR